MEYFVFPDIDPIAIHIGAFGIRWYAIAYLLGFVLGWWYCRHLSRLDQDKRPNIEDIDDIVPWIVFGVILGGRLGYVLFYNLGDYIADPWRIPFVWEGGMSFHGGLLGVIIAIVAYARRRQISILGLSDLIACVVPIGLFFGRVANFINGELFGRITDISWAVIFPYGGNLPRHPSQLYEAVMEGALLLVVLGVLVHKPEYRQKPGFITGIFLIGYSLARGVSEFFREPDPQIGLIGGYLTMGQILTIPMILLGGALIYRAQQLKEKTN